MQGVWKEIQAGWREARWGFYFSVALLPSIAAAVLLAYAIEGPAAASPSPLTWVLCIPATLVALLWAGWKDGLESSLGKVVWTMILLLLVYLLLRHMIRTNLRQGTKKLSVGSERYQLQVDVRVDEGQVLRTVPRHGDVQWSLSPLINTS